MFSTCRVAPFFGVLLAGFISIQDDARADSRDRIGIEIYLSLETDVCGPGGYTAATQCSVLLAKTFDDEVGVKFKPFRSGVLIPPSAIKWSEEQLSLLRRYQLLGRPELSRRWSALVVFYWNGRRPSLLSLHRTAGAAGRPFQVSVRPDEKRTFYHLPLEYLNPAYRDSWTLRTNFATYQIRFFE